MDLRNWLWSHRFLYTHKSFAERLDVTRTYLSHVIHGRVRPSVKLAMRIQELTNGAVKWHELIEKSVEVMAKKESTK